VREYTYDLCASIDGNIITINGVLGKHLELIKQDTKEETPTKEDLGLYETLIDIDMERPISFEEMYNHSNDNYNKLLEEHEELKELHEIALMMIKLGSELL
jgi:ferritin-like protein